MGDWLYESLGVGLTCLGAIASAIGYILQKKGHNEVVELNEISEITDDDEVHPFWKNKIWISGFITYIIGSLLIAAALKFGAQSVLAPLGALTLVCNVLFATKFLGEPFQRNDIFGIFLVIIGSVLAVVFGPKSSDVPITIDYIKLCWIQINFLLFFIGLTSVSIIDFAFTKVYEYRNFMNSDNDNITTGSKFLLISYVSLAAYFGSVNVLFMKSAVIILGSFSISYFSDYLFYVTIVGIILINVMLEYFRQRALKYFDAIFVVPIYQVLLILGSAMMGAVFFNEFANLELYQLLLFIVSVIITLFGVAILAYDTGSVYSKMKKKIKHIKDSTRTIARNSVFRERKKATREVFNVFSGGITSHLGKEYYLRSISFMFNPAMGSQHSQVPPTKSTSNLDVGVYSDTDIDDRYDLDIVNDDNGNDISDISDKIIKDQNDQLDHDDNKSTKKSPSQSIPQQNNNNPVNKLSEPKITIIEELQDTVVDDDKQDNNDNNENDSNEKLDEPQHLTTLNDNNENDNTVNNNDNNTDENQYVD